MGFEGGVCFLGLVFEKGSDYLALTGLEIIM